VTGHAAGARIVLFAMAGETSSDTRIAQLAGERRGEEDDDPAFVVVVRGATAEEARAFAAKAGEGAIGVPDPDGRIAEAAGVRYWPTSVSIDELGLVTAVDVGLDDSLGKRKARA